MRKLEQTYYKKPLYVGIAGSQGGPLYNSGGEYVIADWAPYIIWELDYRRFMWGDWLKNPEEVILFGFDSQYRTVKLQMVGGDKIGEGEYACWVDGQIFKTYHKTDFENYLRDIGVKVFTRPGSCA